METQLLDRIYESCFAPDIWPEVLDEIGREADDAQNILHVRCPTLNGHSARRTGTLRLGREAISRLSGRHCEVGRSFGSGKR